MGLTNQQQYAAANRRRRQHPATSTATSAVVLLAAMLSLAVVPRLGAAAGQLASCPTKTGYAAALNMDISGNTVQTLDSLDSAFTACEADDACKGFNSNGQTKSAVQPAAASSGVCLYTKVPTPGSCPVHGGYFVSFDSDHTGDSIGSPYATVTSAFAACEADASCKGFNSLGEIKSSTSPLSVSRGTCFYTKIPNVCPVIPGYQAVWDSDHSGDSLQTGLATVNATRDACDADTSCTGFSSLKQTKSALFPITASRGNCLYTKIPTGCKPFSGYSVQLEYSFQGTALSTDSNITNLFTTCDANPSCNGFTFHAGNSFGETKASTKPAIYARGVCAYTKLKQGCPAVNGFTSVIDSDVQGNTISSAATLAAAFEACKASTTCVGFSSKGQIKSSVASVAYSRGTCLFIRLPTSICQTFPPYTTVPDVVAAAPITNYNRSFGLAKNNCTASSACKGFSHVYGAEVVTASSVATTTAYGACFYQKTATSCQTLTGYTLTTDADLIPASATLATYPNAAAAQLACRDNTTCAGVALTSSGSWVAKKKGPHDNLAYSYGACFYTKDAGGSGVVDNCATADASVICTNLPGGSFNETCKTNGEVYNATTRKCASAAPAAVTHSCGDTFFNEIVGEMALHTELILIGDKKVASFSEAWEYCLKNACLGFAGDGTVAVDHIDFAGGDNACTYILPGLL